MTDRCEPPEHLRGVDGWHWVRLPFVSAPAPIAWMCNPDNQEREWRMPSSPAFVSGESKTAQTWRYVAPVATPAEVEALKAERDAAIARDRNASAAHATRATDLWLVTEERDNLRAGTDRLIAERTTLRARVEALEAAMRKIANSGIETFAIHVIGGDDIRVECSNRFAHERDVACIMAAARAALEGKP